MTILEGLQQLPEGIRENAIEEYEKSDWKDLYKDEDYDNWQCALMSAFDWEKSDDGYDYWDNVYNGIKPITVKGSYSITDLISFGNYILDKGDQSEVTEADVELWKEANK